MDEDADVLRLANRVAEADDNEIPILLLKLEDILKKYPQGTRELTSLKKNISSLDLLSWCSLALKYDFTRIQGQYTTAVRLFEILCECCTGLNVDDSQEFSSVTLPESVHTALHLCWIIQQYHDKNAKQSWALFKAVVASLVNLTTYHSYLVQEIFKSEDILRLLMEENGSKIEYVCSTINLMSQGIRFNKFAIQKVNKSIISNILDELVYKLTVSTNSTIASCSTRLINEIACTDSAIVRLLSTRFKGLRALLIRWKGNGFDMDLYNLQMVLQSGNIEAADLATKRKAVAVIVASYRGWKLRCRMKKLQKVVPNLQSSFRHRRENKLNLELENKLMYEKKSQDELKRRKSVRFAKEKRLHMLEIVPAPNVNSHIIREEENAAIKIQSVWKGMVERKRYDERKSLYKTSLAAVTIQRAIRKFLERRRKLRIRQEKIPPSYNKLSLDRKNELNMRIKQWQSVNKRENVPEDEVKEIYNKTQEMLKQYHLSVIMEKQINEPRRKALLAKLNTENELLKDLPKLKDATMEEVNKIASNSVAVKMAAEKAHKEIMFNLTTSWWKKLALTEEERNNPILDV